MRLVITGLLTENVLLVSFFLNYDYIMLILYELLKTLCINIVIVLYYFFVGCEIINRYIIITKTNHSTLATISLYIYNTEN